MRICTKAVALLAGATAVTIAVAAPASATPTGRKTISVGVTKSHVVKTATVARPGLVHLHNTSGHFVAIFGNLHRGGTDRLVSDLKASDKKSNPALVLRDFSFSGGLAPHQDAYVPLRTGTYYLLDGFNDKFSASKIHCLTVSGSAVNATAPAKVASVVVERNRSLYVSHTLPRHGYVHFVNHTKQLREALALRVAGSVSDTTVRDFLAHPSFRKLAGLNPQTFDGIGSLSAGLSEYQQFTGKTGRYVVIQLAASSGNSFPQLHKNNVRLTYVK